MQYHEEPTQPIHKINIQEALDDLRASIAESYGWWLAFSMSKDEITEFAYRLMGLYQVVLEHKTGRKYENPFPVPAQQPFKYNPCQAKRWDHDRTPAAITAKYMEYNQKHFLKRFYGAEWTYRPYRRLGELQRVQVTDMPVPIEDSPELRIDPSFSEQEQSYDLAMARKLKDARLAIGLTQLELAKLIGLSSNNRISRWEKGLAKPDVENAMKLERVLKISIRSFFSPVLRKIVDEYK